MGTHAEAHASGVGVATLAKNKGTETKIVLPRQGEQKVFYSEGVPHHTYLVCLIAAEDLFRMGIEAIPHWTPHPAQERNKSLATPSQAMGKKTPLSLSQPS